MSLFGTDGLVFVPENAPLILDDVYHWRRVKYDVRRFGIRIRATAFEEVADRARAALELVQRSPRGATEYPNAAANVDAILRGLGAISGAGGAAYEGNLRTEVRNERATWWLRISDKPAESFFPEDYEREATASPASNPYMTFGSVNFDQLDDLEVALAGDEEEGMPFSLEVPEANGLTRWTIPPLEPLPLIHEFCGSRGVSARGRTVNINAKVEIEPYHQFCTPLGTVGGAAFATLYFYYPVEPTAPVLGRIPEARIMDLGALLQRSGFALGNEGPHHRIYTRDGDVVHLYAGLEGKEAEGSGLLPSFMIVASAAGEYDPNHRADLYESIRETMNVRGA